MKKILITGMSGLIGGVLRRYLEDLGGYELSALNRSKVDGVTSFQADIADLEPIKPAFVGQDVVVHMAASLETQSWEPQLNANIIGTYNVYEAARLAGVSRVVFASSGAAIRGMDAVAPYDAIAEGRYEDVLATWPKISHEVVRPTWIYGAAKVWGEAIGRVFSDEHGLSVLCARIGSVNRDNRPKDSREFSAYTSHRDVADLLHRCIEAPEEVRYDIFYAVSNNKWGVRDLEPGRRVLGFEPRDDAEAFR